MKKFITRILVIFVVGCWCVILLPILLSNILELSWKIREYHYYSDESNFVEVTAKITFLSWDNYNQVLAINFADLPEGFSTNDLYIEDNNYEILLENNATEYLEVGDYVTFITAPRYFGDGYMVPIVELRYDAQIYLAYEEGYENLLESYHLFH